MQPESLKDKNDFYPYAQSNVDFGICVAGAMNGMGLSTRGLVWQGFDIYFNVNSVAGISTAWAAPSGYSGLATTWTLSSGGLYGEYPLP